MSRPIVLAREETHEPKQVEPSRFGTSAVMSSVVAEAMMTGRWKAPDTSGFEVTVAEGHAQRVRPLAGGPRQIITHEQIWKEPRPLDPRDYVGATSNFQTAAIGAEVVQAVHAGAFAHHVQRDSMLDVVALRSAEEPER